MSENSRTVAVVVLGAVGGAVVEYLLFTDRGRALRRELETAIEGTAVEFNTFWTAAQKAATLAIQGWKVLNDVAGEGDGARRFVSANQTLPF